MRDSSRILLSRPEPRSSLNGRVNAGLPMRLDGLPAHPLVVHFPIALLSTSLLWDALGLWTGIPTWWTMSYWTICAGLGMGVPALGTGFWEFVRRPLSPPADRIATWHLLCTSAALTSFLGSLLLRTGTEAGSPPYLTGVLACSLVGVLLLAIGGHLGATLVYQYGVGTQSEGRGGSV